MTFLVYVQFSACSTCRSSFKIDGMNLRTHNDNINYLIAALLSDTFHLFEAVITEVTVSFE